MVMMIVRESSKKGLQLYKSEFNDAAVGDDDHDDGVDGDVGAVVDEDDDHGGHDGHDDSQRIQ